MIENDVPFSDKLEDFKENLSEALEPITEEAPKSDMWALYRVLKQRLEAEGISVNGPLTNTPQVTIEKDFVKDCMAMIPVNMVGTLPEFAPFNVAARVTCIVAKGDNTGLRLDLLKQSVRAAVMQEPLDFGLLFKVNVVVTEEDDFREIGFRKSRLTLHLGVVRTKQKR
jgi:hypothetical protein